MENEEKVIDIEDNKEYLPEGKVFADIKQILNHPQLKNSMQLKRRLLLWLKTQVPSNV